MPVTDRDRRRDEILDAATDVLSRRGYRDTTMLEVARRASASKETLYSWFGDKRGLFEAIIKRNAEGVQATLDEQLVDDRPVAEVLTAFGGALARLLLGDGAVALDRAAISAAASEPELARLLTACGRDATLPRFMAYLERERSRGTLAFDDANQAAQDFLGLLFGDMQIRRLLGVVSIPDGSIIDARTGCATTRFLQLYGT